MQDKKVIALAILAVLAVISLIYGITAAPKSRFRNAVAAGGQIVKAPPSQNVSTTALPAKRRSKRSRFKTWKRNPFSSGREASTASELTLNGIIWDKPKPKAMIGDAIVVKGDTIGKNRVIDIQKDKVVLNDGTKDFELEMEK